VSHESTGNYVINFISCELVIMLAIGSNFTADFQGVMVLSSHTCMCGKLLEYECIALSSLLAMNSD